MALLLFETNLDQFNVSCTDLTPDGTTDKRFLPPTTHDLTLKPYLEQ